MTNVTPLRPNKPAPLECITMASGFEANEVILKFNREMTLEEFLFFYETAQRTAFLMRGMNT